MTIGRLVVALNCPASAGLLFASRATLQSRYWCPRVGWWKSLASSAIRLGLSLGMTLSPEAVTILRSLIDNPHHDEDSPALRELLERRHAKGVAKVHATGTGNRYLELLAKQG